MSAHGSPMTDCAQLMALTIHYADGHDIDGFAGLFTDDGVVLRMGQEIVGREAIVAMMQGRDPKRITRHMLSSVAITPDAADTASGLGYFLLFEADAGETDAPPHPLHAPTVLGEYHQRYRLTEQGWRISEHKMRAVFRRTENNA